jgi:hypothetical protein
MNPDPARLHQEQKQAEQSGTADQSQRQAASQFDSVEEIVRFDRERTPPPEKIAERLKRSILDEPGGLRYWWRRFFGGSG